MLALQSAKQLEENIGADDLSELVAAIYDTTMDHAHWPGVLDRCRKFVGGMAAAIFSKDVTGTAGRVYFSDGNLDPAYGRSYFETYARLDPANSAHLFAELEQPISTRDILDYEEFQQSRFYIEWVKPQGMVDFISASIEKVGGWAAMFGVFRHERDGLADAAAHRRMRLLVPHIRRAVLIGKVIERGSFEAASFGDTLDGLAAGMFLVDAAGRAVHANAAGRSMVEEGRVVSSRDGRIVATDRTAAATLAHVFAAAGEGDAAVGVEGISVTLPGRDGDNYVAHLLPLTSGLRRRTGARYAAVAALFVQRAALNTPVAPELIARTFGLTVSELRVLDAVVQVGGIAETAEALGIGEATVKTHLHRVFAKTSTSRQAELVKLVAGFASPLAQGSAD